MERDCPGSPDSSVADVDGEKAQWKHSCGKPEKADCSAVTGGDRSWNNTGDKGGFLTGVHACTALCRTERAEVPPALLGFTPER